MDKKKINNDLNFLSDNKKFDKSEIDQILQESRYNIYKQTNSGNYIKILSDDKFKFYDLSNYYKNGILKMNLKKKLEKYNNILLFFSDSTDVLGIKIGDNNFLKNNIIQNKNNTSTKYNYIIHIFYILIILFLLFRIYVLQNKIL